MVKKGDIKNAEDILVNLDMLDTVNVAFAVEVSHTMKKFFEDGTLQRVFDRLIALALLLDENDSIDFYMFGENVYKLTNQLQFENFEGFIKQNLISNPKFVYEDSVHFNKMIETIHDDIESIKYEKLAKSKFKIFSNNKIMKSPTIIFVITDSDSFDYVKSTEKLITKYSDEPYFWKFIGINEDDRHFSNIKKLNKLPNKDLPNTSLTVIKDFNRLDEYTMEEIEKLYKALLNDFYTWKKKGTKKRILK